jgi:hypothetical protein
MPASEVAGYAATPPPVGPGRVRFAHGTISLQLLGFPASITSGADFNVTVINYGHTTLTGVVPVIQIVGSGARSIRGSLKRWDDHPDSPWQQAPMSPADRDPAALAAATGRFNLPPGTQVNFNYDLSLPPGNPAGPVTATIYLVQQRGGTVLASAYVTSKILAG